MIVHLFAPGAVPGVDQPILRKSEFYVADMVRRGQAVLLPRESYHRPAAQMTGRRPEAEFDARHAVAGNNDWRSVHASYIPQGYDEALPDGGLLFITTKQLLTPRPKHQEAQ